MTIAAGTKLGRYEITSQLGAGGMDEVYLAEDTKLDRHINFFAYSRDGKQLALSRGNQTRDALMINDESK